MQKMNQVKAIYRICLKGIINTVAAGNYTQFYLSVKAEIKHSDDNLTQRIVNTCAAAQMILTQSDLGCTRHLSDIFRLCPVFRIPLVCGYGVTWIGAEDVGRARYVVL